MRYTPLVAITFLLLPGGAIHAHPGYAHTADLRVWKDAEGLFAFEGSFLTSRGEQVQLRKQDGTCPWIPLHNLSREDREWVRKRVGAIRTLNDPVEPTSKDGEAAALSRARGSAGRMGFLPSVFITAGLLTLLALVAFLFRRQSSAMPFVLCLFAVGGALTVVAVEKVDPLPIQKHFEAFKDKLELRSDADYFYVGSNGLPDHPMMIGIKAWQQQVPLPQPYTGKNAWQIPLKPRLADKPISAKNALFRGAIALAVNGVPIFNALNNRGEDSYLAGELDEYGGHCGRGDDYHYHIAPVHLEKVAGKGNPIAYALDGFPLYGYTDAAGKEPKDLDEYNGRTEKDGYRYYSTKKYPYINGGMRGVVTLRGDQIDPQPRDAPVRPAGQPLRGASITGFTRDEEKKTYTLTYQVQGKTSSVKYTINKDNTFTFVYTDANGKATTETYRRREGKGGQPPKKDGRPPKKDGPPPKKADRAEAKAVPSNKFQVTSPAFEPGGKYPVEFTCDGAGVSPPLAWGRAPEGTKSYALQLWHKPRPDEDEIRSYWVVTHIPATTTSLAKNAKGVGKDGYNGKNRTGYDPMCSKGPGLKEYHITVYALSAEPKFAGNKTTRAELLAAIKDTTLAESTLSYQYERPGKKAAESKQPNLVIFLADDLGWNDVGFQNKEVKTPNLDKLAADGVRLPRFYSYPICSMTRAALLTGLSTSRTGVGNQRGLKPNAHILPQSFHAAGYQTWMFGKWHLGGPADNAYSGESYYPHSRGFDYFYGFLGGAIDYNRHVSAESGEPDWQRNGKQVKEEGYSTDLLADDAIKMLKGRDKAKPVFLYLAFNAVHTPFGLPPSGIDLYRGMMNRKRQALLATVSHMDAAVGRVLNAIDAEGLRNDTLIVFCSDNGGERRPGASNAPLRGEKGTTFEGGIRVPAAVRWPGVLKPGTQCRQVISAIDLFPTLAAAAGVKPGNATPFDGKNLWPQIRDGNTTPPDNLVIAQGPNVAVFDGPWKLVRSAEVRDKKEVSEPMLFRIDDDPEEKTDLAAKHPDVVKDLMARGKAITDLAPRKKK